MNHYETDLFKVLLQHAYTSILTLLRQIYRHLVLLNSSRKSPCTAGDKEKHLKPENGPSLACSPINYLAILF